MVGAEVEDMLEETTLQPDMTGADCKFTVSDMILRPV